jgi:hypothetical protein
MGLMGLMGGLLCTCGVVAGLMALGASASADEPGGVILGEQIPQKTLAALEARSLLRPGERLLAYHDATARLDMSELTFLTSTRVVHARGETVAVIRLADVTRIRHRSEGLLGDVIELTTEDGAALRIEIAPLNGGESYVDALQTAWAKHKPAARIERR